MKKFISIIMVAVMLATMSAVNVGAEGQMYVWDTFDFFNEANWLTGGTLFACEDGWLKGDHHAVVHQSNFSDDLNGVMKWNEASFSVDIAFYDYSDVRDDYGAGLWWRDYQVQEGVEYFPGDEIDTGTVYTLFIYTETRRVVLNADWGSILPETTTVEGQEVDEVETSAEVAVYELPADYELTVDYSNPSIVNLGMRVESNRIRGYLDGKQVIDYTPTTTIGNVKPSPLCLWNTGLMIGFDNFKAATVDYDLFAADLEPETSAPAPSDNTADTGVSDVTPPESSIVTETKVVTDTDEAGNIVSSVVVESSIVTAPPTANTNSAPSAGGNSTATGDMAFVVVAVMVIAFGTAIVVKKVNVK